MLDFASGLGAGANELLKTNKFNQVYIFDINKVSQKFIKERFPNISFYNGHTKVDIVTLYVSLGHFSEPYETFKYIDSILNNSGRFTPF